MKKSQTKDTTGKIIVSFLLLILPEGLLGFSLYWPVLFSLYIWGDSFYWFGFFFGLVVSIFTHTDMGMASLIIVLAMFVFNFMRGQVGGRWWMITLTTLAVSYIADKLMGLAWSIPEGMTNLLLALLLVKMGYFEDDLRLLNR